VASAASTFPFKDATVAEPNVPTELAEDMYYRVIRKMNTFVCERCYNEELREHPELVYNFTPAWYLAMAKLAKEQGWVMLPVQSKRESWFFEEFQVLGPKCAAKQANAS